MHEVHVLKAGQDNFIYVLRCQSTQQTAVIDPTEAQPVLDFLNKKKWSLQCILNTHHHHDHVGGNLILKDQFKCPIYCSAHDKDRVPGADHFLHDNDRIGLGSQTARILHVPGHTLGAISFYLENEGVLFTGDTLFTLGCGRLFEGTAEQMFTSLRRLAELPDATLVYSGHEYGWVNGQFALQQSPKDQALMSHLEALKLQLQTGGPSIPTTMGLEKQLNPFLTARNLNEFTRLRHLKDDFVLEDSRRIR